MQVGRRVGHGVWAASVFALILGVQSPTMADPLADFLEGKEYDREAILRQFPDKSGAADPPGDGKIFLPPMRVAPADSLGERLPQNVPLLAMILPVNDSGAVGRAARNFYEGCLQGARLAARAVQVDLYETDGGAAAALAAHMQAVEGQAAMIIGPMRKESVRALLAAKPKTAVPTVLLQPKPPAPDDNYYAITLDAGREAAQLMRLLHRQGARRIKIVVQGGGDLARRQMAAIEAAWLELSGAPPPRFHILRPRDWQRLFEELKTAAESETDAPTLIFAAGDAEFARRTRNFVPSRFAVFAGSFVYNGARGAEALFLENLRFMEMPWFVDGGGDGKIRVRPVLAQRFFVFGGDVCRLALAAGEWRENWRFAGASGDYRFIDGDFQRFGVLAQYQKGALRRLSP